MKRDTIKALLMMTMLLIASSSSAFTVNDLCNAELIAVDRLHWAFTDGNGDPMDNGPLGSSNEVKIERVYNNNAGRYYDDRVVIRGIIINPITGDLEGMQSYSFLSLAYQFMLADDNNEVTNDGTRLILDCSHFVAPSSGDIYYDNADLDNNKWTICKGYKWNYGAALGGDDDYTYNFRKSNMPNMGFWEGEISRDFNGDLHIDFPDPVIVVDTYDDDETYNIFKGSIMSMFHHRIIDGYHIDLMKYNATLTGKVASYNKTGSTTGTFGTPVPHDPFRCNVRFTGSSYGSDTFEVVNLTGNGYSVVPVESGDPENTFKQAAITGGYYEATNEAWLDGKQTVCNSNRTSNGDKYQHYPYSLNLANIYRNNSAKKFDFEDVVGSMTTSGTLAHRVRDTYWVSDGGSLRTYEKAMSMTLPDFGYVYEMDMVWDGTPMVRYEYSPCYCDNTLDVYEGDVTLDLHHELNVFKLSDDGSSATIITSVVPQANTKYVDSYELWMMPMQNDMTVTSDAFLHENGHAKAFKVASHKPELTRSGDDELHPAFVFSAEVAIPAASRNRKGQYAMFVKPIYKTESGLEPTFHNLVFSTDPPRIPTGIEDVNEGNRVQIIGGIGEIVILTENGEPEAAEVYTTQGNLLYSGVGERIAAGRGLYIVRVGKTAAKVWVK